MRRWMRGETQQEIADSLGLSRMTITRYVREVKRLWKEEAVEEWGDFVNSEWRRLSMLYAEAWDAWERSKLPAESETTVEVVNEDGTTSSRITRERTPQVGNPAFLTAMLAIIDKRMEMLGLKKQPISLSQYNVSVGGEKSQEEITDVDRVRKLFEMMGRPLPESVLAAAAGMEEAEELASGSVAEAQAEVQTGLQIIPPSDGESQGE